MKISYCTSVWNEHNELDALLRVLIRSIDDIDEIVIQGDQGKVTPEVLSVLYRYLKDTRVKYHEYPLRKDFAKFKNQMFSQCSGDWIFNLDADELIRPEVIHTLKSLIIDNPDVDCYAFPRVNYVNGLTPEHCNQWGWKVQKINDIEVVNWPDYQRRLFINNGLIYFNPEIKVHERLEGYRNCAYLPDDLTDWAIMHYKEIDRQVSQNNFYNSI